MIGHCSICGADAPKNTTLLEWSKHDCRSSNAALKHKTKG